MTITEIERALTEACQRAIDEGWELRQGRMFSGEDACCALGAFVRDLNRYSDNSAFLEAVTRFGITQEEGSAIARAFDGMSTVDYDPAFAAIGRNLRLRFLEKQ